MRKALEAALSLRKASPKYLGIVPEDEITALHLRVTNLLFAVSGFEDPTTNMLMAGNAVIERGNATARDVWEAMYKQAPAEKLDRLDRAVKQAFEEHGDRPNKPVGELKLTEIRRQLETGAVPDAATLLEAIRQAEGVIHDERLSNDVLIAQVARARSERDDIANKHECLIEAKAMIDRWLSDSIVISNERFGSLVDTERAAGKNPDDEFQRWDPERGWYPPIEEQSSKDEKDVGAPANG